MTTGTWLLRTFNELTNDELYNILKLRNDIFIVDQQCVFADIDGKDQTCCYHLFYTLNEKIEAYVRIFGPGQMYKEPCLSRVCTSLNQRGKGIGKELMRKALDETSRLFPGQPIRIGAQLYLKTFYESFGFKTDGDPYIEDGIKHILMIKKEPEFSRQ